MQTGENTDNDRPSNEIYIKKLNRSIPADKVSSTALTRPTLFKQGALQINIGGEELRLYFKSKDLDDIYDLRDRIDEIAGINVHEKGAFRSPVKPSSDIMDRLPLFFIIPISTIQLVVGIFLITFGTFGLIIGPLMIALAIFIFMFAAKYTFSILESVCPICKARITVNRKSKTMFCQKCKSRIFVYEEFVESL